VRQLLGKFENSTSRPGAMFNGRENGR